MAPLSRRCYAEGGGTATKSAPCMALQGMEGRNHGTHLASDDESTASTCAPTGAPGGMCPGADPRGRVLDLPHMEREDSLRALSPQSLRRTARCRGLCQRAGTRSPPSAAHDAALPGISSGWASAPTPFHDPARRGDLYRCTGNGV